jgi:hypothetical protein
MQKVTSLFKEAQRFLIPLSKNTGFKDLMNILFNWSVIFDSAIATYSHPDSFRNTSKGRALEVIIENNVIGTELYYRKKEMMSKINALLTKDKINDIIFLVKSSNSVIKEKTETKYEKTKSECEYTALIKDSDLRKSLDGLYDAIKGKNGKRV